MRKLTKEDFVQDQWDSYGKRMYKRYLNMSESEINKYYDLKRSVGSYVDFLYRNRIHKMKIMAVCTEPKEYYTYPILLPDGNLQYNNLGELIEDKYCSSPFEIRLNYTDNKIREWKGFWTKNIDNILKIY